MHQPPLTQLAVTDPDLARLVESEARRQYEKIRLIASENYVSEAVLEATGSVLTNKYSEGYPGRRYYEGQQNVDPIERLAIERAQALFGVDHANVQPYSGSPANLAVYLAFLNPGDTVLGMALPMGGHLTHGWSVSATGRWFHPVRYEVGRETGRVDMDQVRDIARKERPGLIWCGGTAIPRTIDFPAFAEIAREVGAVLAADIAHIAGLVATPSGGLHCYYPGTSQACSSLPRHFIDFKAAGGYVLVPPSIVDGTRYEPVNEHPDARDQLNWCEVRQFLTPPKPITAVPRSTSTKTGIPHLTAWLADKTKPGRNQALFWAACRAAENGADEAELHELYRAMQFGDGFDERQAARTVADAFRTTRRSA